MTDLLTSMCARLYGQRAAKDRAARARSRYQRGCRVSQTVIQAYRFALNPTTRQAADLLRHAGAARIAYNWGLARVKANLAQREAERSYGLTGEELTPPLSWTLYALRKDWNAAKHDRRSAPKKAYNTGPGPARPCVEELGRLQARQAQ